MRYLISYDAGARSTDRLMKELLDLGADHRTNTAWTIETRLTARELFDVLTPFAEEGDVILVVDFTDREIVGGRVPSLKEQRWTPVPARITAHV